MVNHEPTACESGPEARAMEKDTRKRERRHENRPGTLDAVVLLLLGLVATGQIALRKIDGYTKLARVIRERMRAVA